MSGFGFERQMLRQARLCRIRFGTGSRPPLNLPLRGFFAQPQKRRIHGQIMCVSRCTAPLDGRSVR